MKARAQHLYLRLCTLAALLFTLGAGRVLADGSDPSQGLQSAATASIASDATTAGLILVAAFAVYVVFIIAKIIWKATGFAHK